MARQMKDSGVEWIGRIPSDWNIERNKNLFTCSKDIVGEGSSSFQLLSLTTKGIRTKSTEDVGGKIPESYDTYQVVKQNNLVMCLFDLDCSAVFSGLSPYDGMISPAYKVLTCKNWVSPKYYDYWFMYVGDGRKFNHYAKNLRFTLNYEEFATLPAVHPPLTEQLQISDFLDKKCSAIDGVLVKTQESIEEYKKLKQAVITEAVTKGVRGKRPMKDSGIDWIGLIPKEWNLIKVKYCVDITNGSDPNTEGDVPVYGSGADSFRTCGEFKEGPVVLIGRKGATLHIPHYIEGLYWNVDTAFDVRVKKGYCLKWFYYIAGCFDYKLYVSQTTLPSMTQSCYENMFVPALPQEEQQEIADYLDKKCAAIDTLISKKQQFIEELTAYKKSLIYEYVTGKKEVPA